MRNGSSYTQYPEFRLAAVIILYFPPVIVLVGCVGNLLGFLIYIKRKYRNKVAPVYILSLSVIDTINLTIGFLHYWIMFNFYPDRIKPLHCHFMFFLVNAMANHSHWVVIAFTFDRFLAVWFPFWTRNNQRRTRAWITISIIGVVAYAKNLHYLWNSFTNQQIEWLHAASEYAIKTNGCSTINCSKSPFLHLSLSSLLLF
ncbi:neuromedin-U receptor 2-like isoform X2 [Clytia hemisphaerica]|uniref:neuromedin-U receptor 2-like isoform X2 n=1 Tax=Clytia hemisphaerica TaxID=252671 RepID=UPI0034D5059F|eukprot:TCONS_00034734-protein